MRLHICKAARKERLGARDRQRLGLIDELTAAIIAPTGIAFGVFVGKHRTLRLEHRPGNDILGRYEFDLMLLAAELPLDGCSHRPVDLGERAAEIARKERPPRRGLRPGLLLSLVCHDVSPHTLTLARAHPPALCSARHI